MSREWIDSHCHLSRFTRDGRLSLVLGRAQAAGVGAMISIGTEPDDWGLYRDLAASHPGTIFWTAGLHPCDVGDDWEAKVAALPAYLQPGPNGPAALGEIGLDRFHLPKDPAQAARLWEQQQAALAAQLALAKAGDWPVVIHSRDAFAETLAAIDRSGVDWRRVVFHCFSGGPGDLAQLAERGGWASFTGILTFPKNQPIRDALRAQGPEKLLLETDAPYLAPQPQRGQENEPAYLRHTALVAAQCLGLSVAEAAAANRAATHRFFRLPAAQEAAP